MFWIEITIIDGGGPSYLLEGFGVVGPDEATAYPTMEAAQKMLDQISSDWKPRIIPMDLSLIRCQSPYQDGNCGQQAVCQLYRTDMRDEHGSPFCEKCRDQALSDGLYQHKVDRTKLCECQYCLHCRGNCLANAEIWLYHARYPGNGEHVCAGCSARMLDSGYYNAEETT
jgi:hypothetical protein